MKAPDKLTMDPCRFSDVGIFDVDEDEVVYIRKDAVMGIIKDQKRIAMGFSYEHLKMVEDKINELCSN